MIVFSGISKLAIQAAYSQQNCGGGTANNDAFVVLAVSNLNNIYRGKIYISKPLHLLATHFHIRDCRVLSLSLSDHDMFFFCIRQLNWMKAASETKLFRNYAK